MPFLTRMPKCWWRGCEDSRRPGRRGGEVAEFVIPATPSCHPDSSGYGCCWDALMGGVAVRRGCLLLCNPSLRPACRQSRPDKSN